MTEARAAALPRFAAVRVSVDLLDHGVRVSSGVLPAHVVRGWEDFLVRWRYFAGLVDAGLGGGLDDTGLEQARAEARLFSYAQHAASWQEALRRWGVTIETTQVGFDGFISPSRARTRMDSVNASITTLDEHIRARRAQLGEPFLHAWSRWRDTWRSFYGGYPRAWDWWYLGNASAWNETLVYQERLGDWRQAAERAGVRFTVPAPQSAPERRPGPANDWLGSARDIAIAGAIGAGVLGTVYLVSKVA